MKTSALCICLAIIGTADCSAQTAAVKNEPVFVGKVLMVNPQSRVMTVVAEPGSNSKDFHGLERARIEMTGGQATMAELRPGTTVSIYYTSLKGRWYPQRILISDANLAVPASPLTSAEQRALDGKAANDGDITTNPGVKARIDKDITTQPGKKDAADPDITKKRD